MLDAEGAKAGNGAQFRWREQGDAPGRRGNRYTLGSMRATFTRKTLVVLWGAALAFATPADAQFRRGILSESREITLFRIDPPALLLPAGSVEVVVRNASPAPARIVERVREYLQRQITDNDARITAADKNGNMVVTATLTEWNESRRNSTKYVSETRQVGTRQVKDKNGNWKTEPVYEYGRNKPSVVINGTVAMRVEVKPRAGADPLTDQSVRHTISEEHLAEAGPPSRDAVEDMLLDNVIRKAAGRISPGRESVRVLLARSDEVDDLNRTAENRRWQEWLSALDALKPHRDAKRDSYRLHNVAVAHEALAYEADATEDSLVHLGQAQKAIAQSAQQNPK